MSDKIISEDANKLMKLFRVHAVVEQEMKDIFNKHNLDIEESLFMLTLLADSMMKEAGIDGSKEIPKQSN